ncbi:unnamed protein product [Natator depressus]
MCNTPQTQKGEALVSLRLQLHPQSKKQVNENRQDGPHLSTSSEAEQSSFPWGADGTLPFWEALRTLQDQAGRKRRGTGCPRYVSYSGLYICQYNGCRIRTKPSLIVFLLSSVGEFATDVNRKTPVGIRVG